MSEDIPIGRRELLAAIGAVGACAALPATARPASPSSPTKDARLHALLMRHFEEGLEDDPTRATSLNLDVGPRAVLRSRFPDWSPAARAARRASYPRRLAELRALGPHGLSDGPRSSYDFAAFDLEARGRLASFVYHSESFAHRAGPYVVTQLGGFYTAFSAFLETQHPVQSRADAEAYMSRMEAIPGLLDADTDFVLSNAGMGVIAPRFLLEQTIGQLKQLRDGDASAKTLVRSIAQRAGDLGLSGYEDRARRLFEGPIGAALSRQIATLEGLTARATDATDVSRLPQGPDYYAAALRLHTTTDLDAAEIHRLGLEQVGELNGRIDALLKAQGYAGGSIRDRLNAVARLPGQVFPNDDGGRARLIDYLNERLATVRARFPRVFARSPRAAYEIRRVPAEIESGMVGGYAQRGSPDGTRPGIFFINLRDTAEWPRYTLPTLAFHEGAPGHLFEGALSLEDGDLPIYRKIASAPAFGEGWALYAEQVADELGLYEDDPLGKIGYLCSYAFRAARLVIDTGLHAKGWSRASATQYMVANSSLLPTAAQTETDRYMVFPGQACAYKIGQVAISRLRSEAEEMPGYDIRRFHELVLGGGRLPLAVLERRVREGFAA